MGAIDRAIYRFDTRCEMWALGIAGFAIDRDGRGAFRAGIEGRMTDQLLAACSMIDEYGHRRELFRDFHLSFGGQNE